MPHTGLEEVLGFLRRVCATQEVRNLTDAELLERFVASRDEAAFAVLVKRHGPLVLAVCQRVLTDSHAAEDAFQATFTVLVRRAASIRRQSPLASWLYGVAQRIAMKAKARAAARRMRERRVEPMQHREQLDELTWQELRGVLDEEVSRLPEKYKAPIVLCYFQGKSQDQAAKEIGCPRTSVANRLARGRELLRQQLVRRGVALSAGALATALGEKVSAATVGAMLTINTVKAGMSIAAGKAVVGGCLSATAIALAEEATAGALWLKAKLILICLALGLAVSGAGLVGVASFAGKEQPNPVDKAQKPSPDVEKNGTEKIHPEIAADLFGDPLPRGAMARLGTARLRMGALTRALAFSPDGKVLASLGPIHPISSSFLWLWEAATGKPLHRLSVSPFARSIAFSPNSKLLLTGLLEDSKLKLIDVETAKVVHLLPTPFEHLPIAPPLYSFAFSPDGRTVAAAGSGEHAIIILWDVATGKELRRLEGQGQSVSSIAFSPDGKAIAWASSEGAIRLWDVATGLEVQRFDGHEKGSADFVAFSQGGNFLASAGEDGTVRIWDVETGAMRHMIKPQAGTMRCVALSADGNLLATGWMKGVIHLWDLNMEKELFKWRAHPFDVNCLAFSPDGKVLVSCGQPDSIVRQWDTATGKELGAPGGHTGRIDLLRFTPDGKTILSMGRDAKVLEWDLMTQRERGRLFGQPLGPTEMGRVTTAGDLSSDGKVVALAGEFWQSLVGVERTLDKKLDPTIHHCDTATGKEIGTLTAKDQQPWQIRFSPDSTLLASAGRDGIRLWDLVTGKELHHITTGGQNEEVAFSPDAKWLVFTEWGKDVRRGKVVYLWDIASGKKIRHWESGLLYTHNLVFSPDGNAIATATGDNEIQTAGFCVWATNSGKELMRVGGQSTNNKPPEKISTAVDAVAFSPSSMTLAVCMSQRWRTGERKSTCAIHLFDMLSGKEIRKIDTQPGNGGALAFSPDGRILASGGEDSTILLWDLASYATDSKPNHAPLSAKDMDRLWSDMAGDAPQADEAIWTLALAPQQSVPLLKERLQFVPAPLDQVAKLVAGLDSDQFAVRQKAARALDDMGEGAEVAVRKALRANPSLEVRQRLEQFLEKRDKAAIRKLRAVEILEHIGTPQARQVLEVLARQTPNPRVLEAAGAALNRLDRLR